MDTRNTDDASEQEPPAKQGGGGAGREGQHASRANLDLPQSGGGARSETDADVDAEEAHRKRGGQPTPGVDNTGDLSRVKQDTQSPEDARGGAARGTRAALEASEGQAGTGRQGPGAMGQERHGTAGGTGPHDLGREGLGDRRAPKSGDMLKQEQEASEEAGKKLR